MSAFPQNETLATRAPFITRNTTYVDFKTWDAEKVDRVYRAVGHQVGEQGIAKEAYLIPLFMLGGSLLFPSIRQSASAVFPASLSISLNGGAPQTSTSVDKPWGHDFGPNSENGCNQMREQQLHSCPICKAAG